MSGTLVMTCSIEYKHFVAEELSFMYNHQALWTLLAAVYFAPLAPYLAQDPSILL